MKKRTKSRIASALALVPALVVLVYYVSDYRAINSAFDLITQSDAQWNCVNYEAQFYVSEECRIEGSIEIPRLSGLGTDRHTQSCMLVMLTLFPNQTVTII